MKYLILDTPFNRLNLPKYIGKVYDTNNLTPDVKRVKNCPNIISSKNHKNKHTCKTNRQCTLPYLCETYQTFIKKNAIDKITKRVSNNTINILKYKQTYPSLTLQEVANKFGITKQRVHQICSKYGTKTRRPSKMTKFCPKCGKIKDFNSKLCQACRKKENRITITCNQCGSNITLLKSIFRRETLYDNKRKFFCNRHCFGKYIGLHHGFQKDKNPKSKRKQ